MAIDDGRPRRLDGAVVGKLDLEPLSPCGFAIAGEESDTNLHGRTAGARSGGTVRSRS